MQDGIFISELPPAILPLTGLELVPIVQDNVSRQATTGALGVSSGRHAVWITAGSMAPSAVSGCFPVQVLPTSPNAPDIQYLAFGITDDTSCQFRIRMPKSWNRGMVTFVPVWCHPATTVDFTVVWALSAVALSNGELFGTPFGTGQVSIDVGAVTDDVYIGPESAGLTVAGPILSEDLVCFRVTRARSIPSDTLGVEARLLGVTLYMNTTSGNDE